MGGNVATINGQIIIDNKGMGKVLKQSKSEMAKAALEMEKSSRIKVDAAEWKKLTNQMHALEGRAHDTGKALLKASYGSAEYKKLNAELTNLNRVIRLSKSVTSSQTKEMERLAKAEQDVATNARKIANAPIVKARSGYGATNILTAASGTMGGSVGKIGQAAAFGGASAAVLTGGIMAGKSMIDKDIQFDGLNRGLATVMGSSTAARAEIERLREVAKLPGLGFAEAIQGSLNLQAVEIKASRARTILTAFGNALATVGKGKDELNAVQEQIMQMVSKGKVLTEDVRIIRNYVPQISKAMREAFGTANVEEIGKMGISGAEFVDRISEKLMKLPKMTGGVRNSMENMADATDTAFASVGKTIEPVAMAIAGAVEATANAVNGMSESERKWLVGIGAVIAIFGPAALAVKGLTDAYATMKAVRELAAISSAKETAAVITETIAVSKYTPIIKANTAASLESIVAQNASWQSSLLLMKSNKQLGLEFAETATKVSLGTRATEAFRSIVAAIPSVTSIGIVALGAFALEYANLTAQIKAADDEMNHLNDDIPQRSDTTMATPFAKGEKNQLKEYIATQRTAAAASRNAIESVLNSRFGSSAVTAALKNNKDIAAAASELEKISIKRGTGVYNGNFLHDDKLKALQESKFAEYRRLTDLVKNKREELKTRSAIATPLENPKENPYADDISSMNRELSLNGDSTAEAAMSWDILNGKYKDADEASKKMLLSLAKQKDAQDAAREATNKHANEQKNLAEKAKEADEALKEHYAQKLNETLDRMRAQATEAANIRKDISADTLSILKDQFQKEQDLRDKAADEAKSKYEKLAEIGNIGFRAMTNIVMFGKDKGDKKELTAGDLPISQIRAANQEVMAKRNNEAALAGKVQGSLYGNSISRYEQYANSKPADMYGKSIDEQVSSLQELVRQGQRELAYLGKLTAVTP